MDIIVPVTKKASENNLFNKVPFFLKKENNSSSGGDYNTEEFSYEDTYDPLMNETCVMNFDDGKFGNWPEKNNYGKFNFLNFFLVNDKKECDEVLISWFMNN